MSAVLRIGLSRAGRPNSLGYASKALVLAVVCSLSACGSDPPGSLYVGDAEVDTTAQDVGENTVSTSSGDAMDSDGANPGDTQSTDSRAVVDSLSMDALVALMVRVQDFSYFYCRDFAISESTLPVPSTFDALEVEFWLQQATLSSACYAGLVQDSPENREAAKCYVAGYWAEWDCVKQFEPSVMCTSVEELEAACAPLGVEVGDACWTQDFWQAEGDFRSCIQAEFAANERFDDWYRERQGQGQ